MFGLNAKQKPGLPVQVKILNIQHPCLMRHWAPTVPFTHLSPLLVFKMLLINASVSFCLLMVSYVAFFWYDLYVL